MNNVNTSEYTKFYSDRGFWHKVKSVAKAAGAKVIYVALILYYELKDPAISANEKCVLFAALGYLIFPVDLIPDAIPVVGFTDDLAALMAAYRFVCNSLSPEVISKARTKLAEWFDNVDVSELNLDEE